MEFLFSQLKQKDVINLSDGKNLGKICDITVTFPENNFTGVTVTGCKGFKFNRQEVFVPVKNIVKVGEDAVLVKLSSEKPDCPPKRPPKDCPPECPPRGDRRSYDEYE